MNSRPTDQEGRDRSLAAVTAEAIERRIIDLGWPVGTLLGTEPELLERFDVGRNVLRQAIRIVEQHSAGRMRRGRNGGLEVTEPDFAAVVPSMALFLQYRQTQSTQLHDARRTVELRCVELAAENIDEDGIRLLREHLASDPATDGGASGSLQFHQLVAQLTGNPALELFVACLTSLAQQYSIIPPEEASAFDRAHRAHTRIAEAIMRGDAAVARALHARHLDALQNLVRLEPNAPATTGQPGDPTERPADEQ